MRWEKLGGFVKRAFALRSNVGRRARRMGGDCGKMEGEMGDSVLSGSGPPEGCSKHEADTSLIACTILEIWSDDQRFRNQSIV